MFEDQVKGCFTKCKGYMVLQLPSLIETFCDLRAQILSRGFVVQPTTLSAGKSYTSPLCLPRLFEFGVDHELFKESILQRHKDSLNIVPRNHKNFNIVV